jgi:hypothetical protein
MREYFLTLEPLAKTTVAFDLYVLRSVLPLLFADGVTSSDLSLLCPSVRVPAGAKIPSAYSPEDIQAILEAVDRENPQGNAITQSCCLPPARTACRRHPRTAL